MADEIELQAEKRTASTKGTVKSLRRQGRVPGVVYGDKEAAMPLSVDAKSLLGILHTERGRNALITLKIDATSHPVLIKEIQRHPITRALWHVDFHRISLKKKVETQVPVHVKGEAPGVKLGGGILEHIVREVPVRCLPTEIPASLDVDVSSLQINQSLKVRDLPVPKGVELLLDPETVIVNIVAPTILEEPAAAATEAAAAATAAEPEVIKKGKAEEAEAGAEPAAGAEKKTGAAPAAKPEAKK